MSIYHLDLKHTVKSNGTATAAAAYRHCSKIGKNDYSKKRGFIDSMFLLPENAPEFLQNEPEAFWEMIDLVEKKKNARVFSELVISLHHDLTLEQNKELIKNFVQDLIVKRGMAADICIHNSGNNLHAHVQFSYRSFKNEADRKHKLDIFGNKIREEKIEGLHWTNSGELENFRQKWAEYSNEMLVKANGEKAELISHKTLKAQRQEALAKGDFIKAAELDREPIKHIYRNESVQARAEREVQAEKAEIYNRKEKERYELQLELVEMNIIKYEDIVEPVFKPVIKTFEDALKFRKQEKIRKIEENVARYIKDRAAKCVGQFRKARTRAEETIETVRLIVRNQRQRMVNKIDRVHNKISERIDRRINSIVEKQSAEFRNSEQYKLENLVNKAITVLNENKNKEKIAEILNYVDKTKDLDKSSEFKLLLEKVKDYKLKEKIDKKLKWENPYLISPSYKPDWAKN